MSDISSSKVNGADKVSSLPQAGEEAQRQTSPPPPAQAGKAATSPLFATFPQLAESGIDQKMLVDILKKLEADLFEGQLSSESSVIQTDEKEMKDLSKHNQKLFADMLKKVEKQKHTGIIGKVFGWIGAALGVVLGAVLAVVSFGTGATAAGALIAVSVALAVTMVILSASGGMSKMVNAFAKPLASAFEAFGMDAKAAKRAAQITAQVIITVVVIAVQIVLAVASGGSTAANFASELANKIASITVKVTNFALAANQLASAGLGTASGVYRYEAMSDESKTDNNKAILKKIEDLIADEEDTIKEIMQYLSGVQKNMGGLIKSENQSRGELAQIDAQSTAV